MPKSLDDVVSVPAGYTASVLYRLGDPIATGVPAYKNDGTDADQHDQRAGDHHDGMHYFGLDADGKPDAAAADRGLLVMNHEAITAYSCTRPARPSSAPATPPGAHRRGRGRKEIATCTA